MLQNVIVSLENPFQDRPVKVWAKVIDEVDLNEKGGHMFKGPWIKFGKPIKVNSSAILLAVAEYPPEVIGELSSVLFKYNLKWAKVYKIVNGTLKEVFETKGPQWAQAVAFTWQQYVEKEGDELRVLFKYVDSICAYLNERPSMEESAIELFAEHGWKLSR